MSNDILSNYYQIPFRIQEYYAGQFTFRSTLIQLLVIAGAFWLAQKMTRTLRAWCQNLAQQCTVESTTCDDLGEIIKFLRIITPFLAFLILRIAYGLAGHFHWPRELLYIAGIIFVALTLVRLFTGQMRNRRPISYFSADGISRHPLIPAALLARPEAHTYLALLADHRFSFGTGLTDPAP
jgi:hypothetical protein